MKKAQVFKKIIRPFARLFVGEDRSLYGRLQEEKSLPPAKLLWRRFLRSKSAVVASLILLFLFAFVFIAPLFFPMDVNHTDALQQNVPPGYDLLSLPKDLSWQIDSVNGFSDFTVGLGKDGKVRVWGESKDRLSGVDVKKLPREVAEGRVAFVAGGKDHAVALLETGKVVCWGDNSCGQYGDVAIHGGVLMPDRVRAGLVAAEVSQVVCGYQVSAVVTKRGELYAWGNGNAVRNLAQLTEDERVRETGVEKAAFCNSLLVLTLKDGSLYTGGEHFTSVVSSTGFRGEDLEGYLKDRRVVDIAASGKCVAVLLSDGEVVVTGIFEYAEDELPTIVKGERVRSLAAGTRHFIAVTKSGNAYAWGENNYGQCNVAGKGKTYAAYAGSMQTYLVDEEGELVQKTGLKGYLMGTDGRGRDVFTRIVHGGKTTMTIGGVAVILSTLIALIVGCTAGYFGGWVDTLLMRVTEIFSSIPFLPFAMLLSTLLRNFAMSEKVRIFIMMLILGALSWTGLARVLRAQMLAEREKEFVTAAKALGVKEGRIAFRHVLPNVLSVALVSVTLSFASCLLTESSLSYLGFGVQQPNPTWGNMLTGANSSLVIQNYWWQWLFPALFLSVATVCINVVGDGLREALDGKNAKE